MDRHLGTARDWFREQLAAHRRRRASRRDAAGNLWATAPGDSERCVIVGGHLDSVPDGGWLDGALDVLAGLEVLRAQAGESRPLTLKLVDWADEEGARFGRSLLGSSALPPARSSPTSVRGLTDRDGTALPDALREHGVDLDARSTRAHALEGAAAYLELHIEQGPVLERSTSRWAPCSAPSASSATPCASRAARPRGRRRRWTCAATPSWPPRAARWPGARTRCAATTCAPRPAIVKVDARAS